MKITLCYYTNWWGIYNPSSLTFNWIFTDNVIYNNNYSKWEYQI